MTTRRQFLKTSSLSLLTLGLTSRFAAPALATSPYTIRYSGGSGGIVLYAELAEALGYFDNLLLERVGGPIGGPASIQAVATKQIHFGVPFNASIVSARAAGVPIKGFIGYYGTNEITPSAYYVLENSPIRNARDLIGRKVGLNTLGAAEEAFLDVYLIDAGLSAAEMKEVIRIVLPPSTGEQALRSGQVDLVPLRDAALHHAETLGGGQLQPLFSAHGLLGNFTQASYVVRERFIEEEPQVMENLTQGIARAILWAQANDPAEVVARYSAYLNKRNLPEEAQAFAGWKSTGVANAGGVITPNEFATWVNWLETTGEIAKGAVSVEELYTNRFNPFAQTIRPASEAGLL